MNAELQFDVLTPNCREGMFVPPSFAGPEEIVRATRLAEELGYDAVWGADFLTRSSEFPGLDQEPPNWYEPLIALTYAAAVTTRIKLGTGVIMAPFRDPVILAKQVATLDQFSDGRFLLGLGLGAFRAEFEAVCGMRPKANRGRILDEHMEVLQKLLNEDHPQGVSFDGRYTRIQGVSLHPRPKQQPLPIYLPGRTPQSLERVARWCQGVMFASGTIKARMDELEPVLEAHGRSLEDIDILAEADISLASTQEQAEARYWESQQGKIMSKRRGPEKLLDNNWIGTPDFIVDKLGRLIDQGVKHFYVLHIAADTFEESLEQMQLFAEGVMSKLR